MPLAIRKTKGENASTFSGQDNPLREEKREMTSHHLLRQIR
jgi:hypothetical protein